MARTQWNVPVRISQAKRQELYELVWSTPIRELAKREGISDVALRKRVVKFDIPLPPRGYWAKVQAGKDVGPWTPLPSVTRETSKHIWGYAIERVDEDALHDADLTNGEELHLITEKSRQRVQAFCADFEVERQLRNPTSLIKRLQESAETTRRENKERKRALEFIRMSYGTFRPEQEYPFKVSKEMVPRVLRILDTLDKELWKIEGSVCTNEVIGERNQTIRRLQFHILFTVFEAVFSDSEGTLCLTLEADGERELSVRDGELRVEEQLGDLLFRAAVASNRLHGLAAVRERERQRKWRSEEKKSELRRRRDLLAKRKTQLIAMAQHLKEVEIMRDFETALRLQAENESDSQQQTQLLQFAQWVRSAIDDEDPFVQTRDTSEFMGKTDSWRRPYLEPETVWELALLIEGDESIAAAWDENYASKPPIPE